MAEVIMPKMGDQMTEGKIITWHKREGDQVKKGEALAEVETEKANVDIEAEEDGTLTQILVQDGATAAVGAPIGQINGAGGAAARQPASAQAAQAPAQPAPPRPAPPGPRAGQAPPDQAPPDQAPDRAPAGAGSSNQTRETPTPRAEQDGGGAPAATAAPATPQQAQQGRPAAPKGERIKASPLARRLAAEHGLDLAQVQGTGPGGRIERRDIEASRQQAAQPAQPAAPAAAAATGPASEDRELSRMRQAIARNMSISKPGAPHIYLTVDVEMDAALALRKQLNALSEDEAAQMSVNDLVHKAAALALRKFPDLNAHFLDEQPPKVRLFKAINLGFAVGVEGGLMVPVIRDADKKPLPELAVEAKQIYGRMRANKPQPNDFVGGTFTVSNLGMFGIDEFQAVINPPQVGILAVGAAAPQAVVRDGKVEVRTVMRATLSSDHRAVDGVYSARYLQEFKRLMEQPLALVL